MREWEIFCFRVFASRIVCHPSVRFTSCSWLRSSTFLTWLIWERPLKGVSEFQIISWVAFLVVFPAIFIFFSPRHLFWFLLHFFPFPTVTGTFIELFALHLPFFSALRLIRREIWDELARQLVLLVLRRTGLGRREYVRRWGWRSTLWEILRWRHILNPCYFLL